MPTKKYPLLTPLVALLHDQRFVVGLAAIVGYLVSGNVPSLANQQATIAWLILVIAGMLIGGFTVDSASAALKSEPATLKDAIREVLRELIDEVLAAREKSSPADKPTTPAA